MKSDVVHPILGLVSSSLGALICELFCIEDCVVFHRNVILLTDICMSKLFLVMKASQPLLVIIDAYDFSFILLLT